MSSAIYQSLCYEGYDPGWILGKQKIPPAQHEPDPPPPPPPPEAPPDPPTPTPPPPPAEEKKEEQPAPDPPKPPEPIKLKVPFCCEACEEKMRTVFRVLSGVESVTVDFESGLVTITGNVKSEECLDLAQKVMKRTVIL